MLPIEHNNGVRVIKGAGFTRLAMLLAANPDDLLQAHEQSKRFALSTPNVERVLAKAVAAGSTSGSDWAAPMSDYQTLSGEFIELLNASTILGALAPSMRRIPFNTRTPRELATSAAAWVGQAATTPAGEMSFDTIDLREAKCQTFVILTNELMRQWSQASEAAVRASLVASVAGFLNRQFIDPSINAIAGDRPGSITNGVSPTGSTGDTVEEITNDLTARMQALIDAGSTMASCQWVMHPRVALFLGNLRDSNGVLAFPLVNVRGGFLMGLPVIVSSSVPISSDSPGPFTIVVLIDPTRLLLADDGVTVVDTTRSAAVQMDTAPSAGPTTAVSLWQNNICAIRVTRVINWSRSDDTTGVEVLDDVRWGL